MRAPLQLAGALEASMGSDCLLLETLQWTARAQKPWGTFRGEGLERLDLFQSAVSPIEHRFAILIPSLSPASEYQPHPRVLGK